MKSNWNILFVCDKVDFTEFWLIHKKQLDNNANTVHTVEKWKIYSHRKKNSSNQQFSNFISKTVTFTKFFPKKCERKFP